MDERNEENIIGSWVQGNLCYVVLESLSTLLSAVMWKVENVPNEPGDLVTAVFYPECQKGCPLMVKCERRQVT